MRKQIGSSVHSRNADGAAARERDDLAAEALTFLAADPERLGGFFAVTGITVDTVRQAAAAPDFAVHLLDYLAADEQRFLAFASSVGRNPAAIEAIRAALAPSRDDV